MDRAGLPLRTGPESVDLVIADIGRRGLRGEVGFDPVIAAVAASSGGIRRADRATTQAGTTATSRAS